MQLKHKVNKLQGLQPPKSNHQLLTPRTPAPLETSTEAQDEPTDNGPEPEQINIHSPEVDMLAAQAESLHLPATDAMATQTQTQTQMREEPPYLFINPITGQSIVP